MKLAYFVLPHVGGTFSVFKSLRAGLAPYGHEVRWFGACEEGYEIPVTVQDEVSAGDLLTLPAGMGERACAVRMVDAIRTHSFDGVIINVLGDRLQTNIARYLPEDILRIMVVHNITPGTYAAARSIRDYTHTTIGVSERCRMDLVERYGFPAANTHVIENAVDAEAFKQRVPDRERNPSELRVLYVGRIEDASKGVLWLKEILDALPKKIKLTIVGNGPDMAKLKRRLSGYWKQVDYLGAVSPLQIPTIMANHDVLIMPSRYEGLPMTLIEAMAAGCVPVVSRIRGVTDTVVDHETTGFLFPVGNYMAAASAIAMLDGNRDMLDRISLCAGRLVPERFGIETMARRYHEVISSAAGERRGLRPPLEIDSWTIPAGLRPGLRTYVPLPLKNWLRVVRERL